MAYTAAQPVQKGKTNKCFNNYKKYMEDLKKEIISGYDEEKHKNMIEEGKKTWKELKSKKKVKF